MTRYSAIIIIYNPNSTGPSKTKALEVAKTIRESLPRSIVKTIATKHRGHAETIAYRHARATARPLILSSSGDGGYHEVVNGVMRASLQGARVTTGLIPAGNANDHYHSIHDGDLVASIEQGKSRKIDLLQITSRRNGKPYSRYAHSYIGFGFSPRVGQALTQKKLNRLNEVWITFRTLITYRSSRLMLDGTEQKCQSLIFSNVKHMAKYLTLSKKSQPDDGLFEVSLLKPQSKISLFFSLLNASLRSFYTRTQTNSFKLRTVRRTLVQLDGETVRLDADSGVSIAIKKHALRCIV